MLLDSSSGLPPASAAVSVSAPCPEPVHAVKRQRGLEAQRAFRKRKAAHLEELEHRVALSEAENAQLKGENGRLKAENEWLRSQIQRPACNDGRHDLGKATNSNRRMIRKKSDSREDAEKHLSNLHLGLGLAVHRGAPSVLQLSPSAPTAASSKPFSSSQGVHASVYMAEKQAGSMQARSEADGVSKAFVPYVVVR